MNRIARGLASCLQRRTHWIAGLSCLGVAFAGTSVAQARLAAPRLQSPAARASVQSLPAFTWSGVKRAAQYEFQFSADRTFSSGVNGFGAAGNRINTTAITNDKTVADGTYYWRVRAITAQDNPGAWSAVRTLKKGWTSAPRLLGPLGDTVSWPSNPLVLRWSAVPHATSYLVTVATDPALANVVLGSVGSPQVTQGTVFAYPTTLSPGQYYWAVTPVDSEGDRGHRSAVASFVWTWPSTTAPTVTNISSDPGVVDPQFSWNAVPGAAGYQVEVNSSQDFPPGSKACCDGQIPGTSLTPTGLLAHGTYYWRVRAIDPRGDGGVWNVGQPFSESFDASPPTVPNLALRDIHNNMQDLTAGSSTDTPIVTWDPVPGASSYEIQLTPYQNGFGCDWTNLLTDESTATTAWTPGGVGGGHIGPAAWPSPQRAVSLNPGTTYCFRLLARRDDGSPSGQIVTDWTQLGGFNAPAFQFPGPPTGSGPVQPTSSQYLLPADGVTTPRTPLFTWSPVPGANGYYVVVARDQFFTDVVDVGFTNVPAYAPEIHNKAPYADETTAYWWAVVPSMNANGSGVNTDPEFGQGNLRDNPQLFNKSSVPPTLLGVTGGSNATVEPTFAWTSAEGARDYELQVATDPSFAQPITDVTTDSTAYTTTATLPAAGNLYWRVRATDVIYQGLNWSSIGSFTHRLPVPIPAPSNPAGGHSIPLLAWSSVPGAISYDMHVDLGNGGTQDFSLDAPVMTLTSFSGTGILRWEVRADFPGSNASSAYFSPEARYVRAIPAPGGIHATKSGPRIVISWTPDSDAKQYQVALSATPGFASPVASDSTDNTVWVPQIDSPTAAKTLYWRVAAIDQGGNVGAYDSGVFHAPHKAKPAKKKKKKKPKKKKKRK